MITKEQSNKFYKAFRSNLKPISDIPLWEWLEQNVPLPDVYNPAGTFDINFYPYLKKPMQVLLDDNIKQVNLASCTQGGKSLLGQVFIPYIILESPGPLLMVHDTEINAKKCVEERIIPLLKSNKYIKRLLDNNRFAARKSGIQLPHMTFRVTGPAESNLLGYTARIILGDEIWRWQADGVKGILEKLPNRQTAYQATRKIVLTSQPDYEGSEWHAQCLKGLWYEYGYRCPKCNVLQRYEWNGESDNGDKYGMIMDDTTVDDQGNPNYFLKAKSSRIVCKHCLHAIHDTPTNRKDLVVNGDYILIHQGNDEQVHTYSWSQFVNRSVTFSDISLRYLAAVTYRRATGSRDKHEVFRQQTLGKFWGTAQIIDNKKLMTIAYSPSEAWSDETIRFLTLDVQKDYMYWLVRAWSNKIPESRLIDWGTIVGFAEVEELIQKYKIHPLCIGIDSGYTAKNIYAESIQRGKVITINNKKMLAQWTCLRGDGGKSVLTPRKFYKHKLVENGKTIEIDRLYAPVSYVDPQLPINSKFKQFKANLYTWSNYSIKSILFNLRDKKLPFAWNLNERANSDYTTHLFSEQMNSKNNRYERIGDTPNHALDLECMQLVMALQSDCYHPAASELNDISKTPDLV